MRRLWIAGLLLALLGAGCQPSRETAASGKRGPDDPVLAELSRRAANAEDLDWLAVSSGEHPWLQGRPTRSSVIERKHQALADGDAADAARMSAILAGEAQLRAARVLERWIGRLDPETGLLPRGVAEQDHAWVYADTAADLFPHLLIAAALLRPSAYEPLAHVIAAERSAAPPPKLPADIDLTTDQPIPKDVDDEIYGAVEYAKDGLLPLTERLGPGPWLDRLRELADVVDRLAPVETRFGRIPDTGTEVNGQALQVLARLYWATGEERYRAAAERIADAYLEQALPHTGWIPVRNWDFAHERETTDYVQLRDHGNEIVAGLVEFHLIETVRAEPDVAVHRQALRTMLDRLLEVGRAPDGLWRSAIDLDDGEPLKSNLSDNWGYLYAAYLTQALIEERWPAGDPAVAQRYRAAAQRGLEAAAQRERYPWQGTEQDGYADTIESALYLLQALDAPAAARWVDRQASVLFGTQDASGRVEDGYLDGNFIRTALLYAAWQTRGLRLAPWEPAVMLGAAPDGGCLVAVLASSRDWQGTLVFDAPRHQQTLHLPVDYPRLNAWPEWFAVAPGRAYQLVDSAGLASGRYDGATLTAGLPLALSAGQERQLRVCPQS